ncbi:MAG: magnesium chelatase [Firmicutes bacterium]|jgi:magnesium chelatase subunit I|nr:magnesium chelatase [Bacillota bacterium]MDH7495578.1 magnesium chelatase [Bacillota bacterium]
MKGYLDLVVHDGNRPLMEALEASVVSLLAGRPLHVHVEGLRGTGKTTIIRAMRDVLPSMRRIKGCPYNCDPESPHCPEHRGLCREAIEAIGTEEVPVPFLEISHAAKIGTVVGSIDLARIVDPSMPEAALLPGVLPRAHRGVVFIDEINRLADTSPELTDVLLDVMGTKPGRLQVEETGLPTFEIPITCAVWAASNPDEEPGALEDIRRQLSDRFDFTVNMARPQDQSTVKRILLDGEDRLSLQPSSIPGRGGASSRCLEVVRERMLGRAAALPDVTLPDDLASLLAEVYVSFGMESLRAVEAISLGARVRAALCARPHASIEDVRTVLPFALRHRVDASTLISIGKFFDEYESRCGRRREVDPPKDETSEGTRDASADEARYKDRDLGAAIGEQGSRPDTLWERLMKGMGFTRPDAPKGGPTGGGRSGSGQASPRASAAGAGPTGGGGADCGSPQETSHESRASAISDPTDFPLVAPPMKARSLAQLAGGEVVFTEEDLRLR